MTTIALITGADKGMGREAARQLGEQGAIVLIGSRSSERGESTAAELRGSGIDARSITIDVADDGSIAAAAEQIGQEVGRLDVLINNAGIYASTTPTTTDREALRRLFEVNTFGLVAVTNAMLPLLRRSDAPRIVNVSTEVASLTEHDDPESPLHEMVDMAYQASKTAVNMITLSYAQQLKDDGIKVNAAVPGYVKTDFNQNTGVLSAEDGASVSVHLATLPDDGPTGQYWGNLQRGGQGVVPW